MLKLTPLLLALAFALVTWRFSTWRLGRELDARSVPLADPQLKPALDRLARALDLATVPVHLYEIAQVNGLAAPDGRIFLTRGFYDKFRKGEITGEELASVVAHELGHVALGHSRRRMIDFSGQNVLRMALSTVLGRFLPGIGAYLVNAVMTLLAARLSRSDEYEADAYASALLVKAGIGTAPQKSLFSKLNALAGAAGSGAPAWLLSHPAPPERIAAIEANEAKWGLGRS